MFNKADVMEKTKAIDLSYIVNFKKAFIGRNIIIFHCTGHLICGEVEDLVLQEKNKYLAIYIAKARSEIYKNNCKPADYIMNFLVPTDEDWIGAFIGGHLFVGPPQARDTNIVKYLVVLKNGCTSL